MIDARKFLPDLKRWEGAQAHIYRDNATAGNATVGIGCMLPNLTAALTLPFEILVGGELQTASEHDVMNDFGRVLRMSPGLAASAYKAPTSVLLPEDAIEQLAVDRIAHDFVPCLLRIFPGFAAFPGSAQSALLDMAFNLGIGTPSTVATRATGLQSFPTLIRYANAYRWDFCELECHVKQGREERNDWRRQMFRQANGDAPVT